MRENSRRRCWIFERGSFRVQGGMDGGGFVVDGVGMNALG